MHDESAPRTSASIAETDRIERDRRMILEAKARGPLAKLWAYTKLSGPGWLQSAITLGGGSLTGSLFLGVLAGFSLLWLQPLAMILGVIMLSAIASVTLATGERPFRAINRHVNPVLGWGWAIATLMANLVWCMPQFSLGVAAIRQNLLPEVFGGSTFSGPQGDISAKIIVVAVLFVTAATIVFQYDRGGWGLRLFEIILKLMVAVVVVSFVGVVVKMATSADGLPWDRILRGLVPNPELLFKPAPELAAAVERTGDMAGFWSRQIVDMQRDVMITAAATAVGINMTFLLPYSMLARGWNRDFRGLAIFDLSTGLFVPFVLATGCVVIAAAARFHAEPAPGFLGERDETGAVIEPHAKLAGDYRNQMNARLRQEIGEERYAALAEEQARHDAEMTAAREAAVQKGASGPVAIPGPLDGARERMLAEISDDEKRLAAMLVRRDAFQLANSLERLTGKGVAQYVFGIGVLGMAISTIIILMLINGFVVCEMLGVEARGTPHRMGALLAGVVGGTGPFIWGSAQSELWLAIPTSVFGMVLLPIAYVTFFLMMNSSSLMGANRPRGAKRIWWNTLMIIAIGLAAFGSIWSITSKTGVYGLAGLGAFILLVLIVQFTRTKPAVPGSGGE